MSSVSASCGVYRRPSIIESAAAGIGARLLSWSEKRRLIQVGDPARRAAAIARLERLGELRANALSAAHSGLEPRA
ncbi:2-nitropropane dioxygenase [Arthrobacter celericrescens]|uniref:2-nitropropane dioxygenase n=1 Tax=Arthrobacter celericrescens TaxID=2320851 RepID=UPI000EA29FA2|nr:2-nitropropane dioxygenase [Arthrobacter celericrescens]